MSDSSDDGPQKIRYKIDEREKIWKLKEKYGTSPFTGECYTWEIQCDYVEKRTRGKNTWEKFYSIKIPTEIAEEILFKDFIQEDPNRNKESDYKLLMIKPVEGDGNYIFFRRI